MSAATTPHFPSHGQPRVWLITSASSPIGIAVARELLKHGDFLVAGVELAELSEEYDGRGADFANFQEETVAEGWDHRYRAVGLDERKMGQCQAAVAQAISAFGKLDILFCCSSEAIIGTVEELAASRRTQALVRDQFETNFFGPVNIIKAALPAMRERSSGHVITLTGITGHLGTPGLGVYCASGWALEGFCDSLAYEIAPFNIKMTIVQPNLEINVLTNRIAAAPLLPQYSPQQNPAPLSRSIIGGLLSRLSTSSSDLATHTSAASSNNLASTTEITPLTPNLPPQMQASLVAETVNAITAIGGHENPPARHIVGFEGIASVKEKLKTVSEELEDFVEVSCAVDIDGVGEGGLSL